MSVYSPTELCTRAFVRKSAGSLLYGSSLSSGSIELELAGYSSDYSLSRSACSGMDSCFPTRSPAGQTRHSPQNNSAFLAAYGDDRPAPLGQGRTSSDRAKRRGTTCAFTSQEPATANEDSGRVGFASASLGRGCVPRRGWRLVGDPPCVRLLVCALRDAAARGQVPATGAAQEGTPARDARRPPVGGFPATDSFRAERLVLRGSLPKWTSPQLLTSYVVASIRRIKHAR